MNSVIDLNLGHLSYKIYLGPNLLENSGDLIAPLLKNPRVFIIADENAWKFHGNKLINSLVKHEITTHIIITNSGEQTKSFQSFERVCEEILSIGIDRHDLLIAFGGGVVGDLTGFVAAVLNRGIGFVQIPTTLLSQVDSSVGGKTAINAKSGKNLIGVFHQPRLVIADTQTLSTLDTRDLKAGFSEIYKIGLIMDQDFFDYCENNAAEILQNNSEARHYAIKTAITAKAKIVEQDEREQDIRALLNLGHTFGHAIEAATNYDETIIRHGEAVGMGIAMAARFSNKYATLSNEQALRIENFLKTNGYFTKISEAKKNNINLNPKSMLQTMLHDKKNSNGKIALILLENIGKGFQRKGVDEAIINEFLHSECEN